MLGKKIYLIKQKPARKKIKLIQEQKQKQKQKPARIIWIKSAAWSAAWKMTWSTLKLEDCFPITLAWVFKHLLEEVLSVCRLESPCPCVWHRACFSSVEVSPLGQYFLLMIQDLTVKCYTLQWRKSTWTLYFRWNTHWNLRPALRQFGGLTLLPRSNSGKN